MIKIKKLQKPRRVKVCKFDRFSAVYPTDSELNRLDDIYMELFNIHPEYWAKNTDSDINVSKSKENYSTLSYRQQLLNYSKKCRLSGLNPKDVRVKVDLWKKNYWGN